MAGRVFLNVRPSRKISGYVLRTPLFSLRTDLFLVLLFMGLVIAVQTARAENFKVCTDPNASWDCLAQDSTSKSKTTKTTTTTTITTTTTKGETDEVPPASAEMTPAPTATQDFVITSTFGSKATSGTAGCKTHALAQDVVKKLKAECTGWMNERKAELKSKYQTGTCEEDCTDCGMSLQRCTVTGAVHYSK